MKLGILGGGQLAQMLTLAAYPLGIRTRCFDPSAQACSGDLTPLTVGDFDDYQTLDGFLADVDCVTLETENIPLSCAERVLAQKPLFPTTKALEISQDRLHEKTFFQQQGVPTAAFQAVDSKQDLQQAVANLGLPAVLKTRRFGYDGKGQFVLRTEADIDLAWESLSSQPLILEKFIPFEYEVSLIAVRGQGGEMAFYPLVLNVHRNGILQHSLAPYDNSDLQIKAQEAAAQILQSLHYVGVLTIEFFVQNQTLIANEMAPRVHNSGHWTIEGAQTSQFENHVRAVCGLPLGSTQPIGQSLMLNMIGEKIDAPTCLAMPGVHYHDYGKSPRPGRKLGHVTLVDTDRERFQQQQEALLSLITN